MRHATKLLILLLFVVGSARAQDTQWTWSCRYDVEVDGASPDGAAVFERRGSADILGLLPGNKWFLVKPPKQVFELPAGAVQRLDGQTAVLKSEPTDGSLPVTITPSGLTFDVAGNRLRIVPTPELLGETTPEEFLGLCPEFRRRAEVYVPRSDSVQTLAASSRDLKLEIYFGSWCPHCQEVLPRLFKSLDLANNTKLQVRMIGLPRSFGRDPAVRAKQIRGVPTIIVTDSDGAEVGRFSGDENTAIEETLAQLVGG